MTLSFITANRAALLRALEVYTPALTTEKIACEETIVFLSTTPFAFAGTPIRSMSWVDAPVMLVNEKGQFLVDHGPAFSKVMLPWPDSLADEDPRGNIRKLLRSYGVTDEGVLHEGIWDVSMAYLPGDTGEEDVCTIYSICYLATVKEGQMPPPGATPETEYLRWRSLEEVILNEENWEVDSDLPRRLYKLAQRWGFPPPPRKHD